MPLAFDKPVAQLESRVLFLPPTRRDAQITVDLLKSAGMDCHVCDSVFELGAEIDKGVGTILITEEGVCRPDFDRLAERLKTQPDWSDIPVVLLAKARSLPEFQAQIEPLSNLTLVDRPAPVASIVSAVETAVKARARQYQVRDKVREVAQAAEQFEVMANAIPQLAWMADRHGNVFWCNRRWFEYTGTEYAQVQGWDWTCVVPGEVRESLVYRWSRFLQDDVGFEIEIPLVGADQVQRSFLGQVEPIKDEAGNILRWLATFTDIEEQRRLRVAREAMIEGERHARMEAERAARLKDEFLATLSHELRNPLSSILGWAYLIKKSPNDPQIVSDAGEVIGRSGESLKALVDDLLDLSRISSGKLRLDQSELDIVSLANTVVDGIRPDAESKKIPISSEVIGQSRRLWGDSGRIQQIISNLLSNAVRFTKPGGEIRVVLKFEEDAAYISVADTGEGIEPQFLPYVFDRFRQADASTARKHGGMGIGLSLVKQFAELHGGEVSVDSEGPNKGSTFTVKLPYRQSSNAHSDSTHDQASTVDLSNVSVLIVDDDPLVRDLLDRVLLERGASTSTASSAQEALEQLARAVPDVLVSDIGMPHKDGYELIHEVRQSGINVPAIALTAFVRKLDKERALEHGFQHHLTKPVELSKLLDLVYRCAQKG